jgi:hypothetical protein
MASIKILNAVSADSIRTLSDIPGASIRDVSGVEMPAQGTGDAFKDIVESSEDIVAWWSPNGAEAGNIADDGAAMSSMYETNPGMGCKVSSAGNWQIVADNPGGTAEDVPASLQSAVAAAAQSKTDFCALFPSPSFSSALATALDSSSPPTAGSGFLLFKMEDTSPDFSYLDILQFSGLTDTGTGADNSSTRFIGTWASDVAYIGGIKQNVGSMGTALVHSIWYYLAWTFNGTAITLYQVKADGTQAWDNVVSMSTTSNETYIPRDGLSFGRNSSHGAESNDSVRWGPLGLYSGEIGVGTEGTTLRTIFEGIIVYID